MVLIDIITRQLHDICPGEKVRGREREKGEGREKVESASSGGRRCKVL